MVLATAIEETLKRINGFGSITGANHAQYKALVEQAIYLSTQIHAKTSEFIRNFSVDYQEKAKLNVRKIIRQK